MFEDRGLLLPCVERTGQVRGNKKHIIGTMAKEDDSPGGLYILACGRATVSCGEYSMLVQGGVDECNTIGIVLGRLSIPEDARDFFREAKSRAERKSVYRRFVALEKRRGNVSIHFEKGATYLLLPESTSQIFLACRAR